MIDVSEYIEKLNKAQSRIDGFVDALAFSYRSHMVIITDVKIPFPKYYEYVKHDDLIELSNVRWDKHERGGWSKPDLEYAGIEIRYLWKQFRPAKL